jgi:hypothetical protein
MRLVVRFAMSVKDQHRAKSVRCIFFSNINKNAA